MISKRDALRILSLRRHGISYGRIAQMTNITRDRVRTFCDKHGVKPEHAPSEYTCGWCGKPVAPQTKCCSASCRHKLWRNERMDDPATVKVCEFCGKTFHYTDNPHQKYCSRRCYLNARYYNPDTRRSDETER